MASRIKMKKSGMILFILYYFILKHASAQEEPLINCGGTTPYRAPDSRCVNLEELCSTSPTNKAQGISRRESLAFMSHLNSTSKILLQRYSNLEDKLLREWTVQNKTLEINFKKLQGHLTANFQILLEKYTNLESQRSEQNKTLELSFKKLQDYLNSTLQILLEKYKILEGQRTEQNKTLGFSFKKLQDQLYFLKNMHSSLEKSMNELKTTQEQSKDTLQILLTSFIVLWVILFLFMIVEVTFKLITKLNQRKKDVKSYKSRKDLQMNELITPVDDEMKNQKESLINNQTNSTEEQRKMFSQFEGTLQKMLDDIGKETQELKELLQKEKTQIPEVADIPSKIAQTEESGNDDSTK